MMAAIFAASSVFVSCSKDDDPYVPKDAPTISAKFGGDPVTAGSTVVLKLGETKELLVDYKAPGLVKTFALSYNGNYEYPEEVGKSTGSVSISFKGDVKGEQTCTITITDNQAAASEGMPESIIDQVATFTFKIDIQENDLVANKTFTVVYLGGVTDGGANAINEEHGIWYHNNPSGTTGRIDIVTSGNNFAILANEAAYTAIKTRESLKTAYDSAPAADKRASFTANAGTGTTGSGGSFVPVYFISKVGNNYFLIKMTGLRFDSGTNTAYFDSKK